MTYTSPPIRKNLECGFDPNNISSGREPCQMGWYSFIATKYCQNASVIDIGAGMCDGIKLMRTLGPSSVTGQDIDNKLKHLDDQLIIDDVANIPDKSYDYVTNFDVIEHVINDLEFFNNLTRIARKGVFITTPNYSRSKAQNHCHCREYTIPEFVNYFRPNELWVAAPDGHTHHTLILKRDDFIYTDLTRPTIFYNKLPLDTSFAHSTVDGNEWAHMLGLFLF